MERQYLICAMMGFYVGQNLKLNGQEIREKIDQFLLDCCFTPLGQEPGDMDLVNEVHSELLMGNIGRGMNRNSRRFKKNS